MSDPAPKSEKKSYKDTLNLPKTDFAMKANLVQREPQFQQRWSRLEVYQQLRRKPHPKGRFLLHDGPPYANGAIHLGHMLNKVLKDLVVRSRSMLGYDAPFVPGWDCHGLPIEHKVMKDLGPKARGMSAAEIRGYCQKDAEKFVNLQRTQMQRLGTIADYGDPYLTMAPAFEAATLEVFGSLVSRGLVYRQLKPVHWSIANRTALADAELEYAEREDTSVYVLFEVANPEKLPRSFMARPDMPVNVMIWTTTPWTLPANLAVAISPQAEYGMYHVTWGGQQAQLILAADLASKVFELIGASHYPLGLCSGAELEAAGIRYTHPFIDRTSPIVTADYVTLEDGTGMVHTAPGHGVEDYQTGLRVGLEIYCPVKGDGTYDDSVPEWLRGKGVWDANSLVVERLRESGHLFHDHKFTHSYPHDWRSKTPVIFRATEQWFIGVDRATGEGWTLRGKALEETKDAVRFIPEWGRNRMRGMLESRPDWCVSRQRAWGLPIPAFFSASGEPLLTQASVQAVAEKFRQQGADAWFKAEPRELLSGYNSDTDPDAPAWIKVALRDPNAVIQKGPDTFDVWFESGSSWNAVLRQRNLGYPADLYLEGSDQHRGWFQHSLLPALGVTGQSPFKAVLTHGFMVDAHGQKMSKSLGNALEVEDLLKEHGADVCRWWVASLNSANDIKVDKEYFRVAGEEYRKVRNTIRILLANLADFDPKKHRREIHTADAATLDAWARQKLNELIDDVRSGYESYNFAKVHEAIFTFCNNTMSAVYVNATKDRLYCDAPDSPRRRRTQTVMYDIVDALIRLVAPILVHTADEAYLALHRRPMDDADAASCVHLAVLPEPTGYKADPAWEEAMALRDRALKNLEDARAQRGIDNPLDAGIEVTVPHDVFQRLQPFEADLADLLGVSRFELENAGAETIVVNDLRSEPRCERSWKRDGTVKPRSDGSMLSDRDAAAVNVA